LRPQVYIALFFITFGVLVKFAFIDFYGVEGMISGSIFTFILIQPIIYGWLFRDQLTEILGIKSLSEKKE
jgi:hypothetical protein